MNVALWADRHLERYGDYEVLIVGDRRWSNGELHQRSCRVAGGLVERGLSPGDRVVLCLPHSELLVVAFNAVLRAGCVAVVVDRDTPPSVLEKLVGETEAVLVLTDLEDLESCEPLAEPVVRDDEDPAQIVLTSGSSGEPKGVVWFHSTIQARYLAFADERPPTARPRRSLCALPFSSSFGTQYLYLRMLQKMQLVLPRSLQPGDVLSALEEHRVQTTMLVPSLCESLLQSSSARLPSLKSVLVGGAEVSEDLLGRFEERFGVRPTPVYGLTELGPVTRDGRVSESLEVRISEGGEVEVRAGASAGRYLGQDPAEDWFKTGDLGRFVDGRLQILGRSSDRILQGGATISPAEIEEVLRSLGGVRDCAVVGVSEPFLGEEVVAFVVAEGLTPEEIHRHCKRSLDRRRRPTRICLCSRIPRNDLGKVKRHELKERAEQPGRETPLFNELSLLPGRERSRRLRTLVEEHVEEVELDSLERVTLAHRLSDLLGKKLPATLAFNHPPVDALAHRLNNLFEEAEKIPTTTEKPPEEHAVAIIGIGCRLPGTDSPDDFWELLCQGEDFTREIERWGMPNGSLTNRAALADIEQFDAGFFGWSMREATATDPQHRMTLESAWHALEHAGYDPRSLSGSRCGVFLGISGTSYGSSDALGVSPSMAAGRVSHLLNLKGPAMAIDTSCSSSLVAIQSAVQSLRRGDIDLALAGGVNAICTSDSFLALSRMGVLASDGRCKAFDAAADGFARGEGCVIFLLKRHSEALRDGDSVVALIRGVAVNHDGSSSSLSAPNGTAQQGVIREALQDAGLRPGQIDFWEAHGTGTALGDPIELEALAEALGPCEKPLPVGAVKTNVGHLEAAAGAVGLLKAAYTARSGLMPPNLHFRELNPLLKEHQERFVIPTEPRQIASETVRGAVMSMGMSGTNACVVVESPSTASYAEYEGPFVLCLSARNVEAFEESRERHLKHLSEPLGSYCQTAAMGRRPMEFRGAVVGADLAEIKQRLQKLSTPARAGPGRLAFVFTGQGAFQPGQGSLLYETREVFRRAYQQCSRILGVKPEELLATTTLVQPATVALEWSLFQLWQSWGVNPDLVCGHSLGEFTAACVAGVLDLEEALRLVHERGVLMDSLPAGGSMLAVSASADEVVEVVSDDLEVGAINSPRSVVLSGGIEACEAAGAVLSKMGMRCGLLAVGQAFHSKAMDPILDRYYELMSSARFELPSLPLVSSVTVEAIREESRSPEYWRNGLRQAVRFGKAVDTMVGMGAESFLEVGPQASLLPMIAECRSEARVTASLRRGVDERAQMLEALAELYEGGCNPHWQGVFETPLQRRPIPVYPFQRRPYWGSQPFRRETTGGAVTTILKDARKAVERAVLAALGEGVKPTHQTDLWEAGLASLRVMNVIGDLRKTLAVTLTPADLITCPTIDEVVALVEARRPPSGVRLVALRAGGEGVPLICVHPSGGHITAYLTLRPSVPAEHPLYAIQTNEVPASIESVAIRYADLLEEEMPEGAVSLLGWSLGAVIALEMTTVLESRGRVVEKVHLVDPPVPGGVENSLQLALAGVIYDHHPRPPSGLFNEIGEALKKAPSDSELLSFCEERDWLPKGLLDKDLFTEQLGLYRGHLQLLKDYEPKQVGADVTVYRAARSQETALWGQVTTGHFQDHVFEEDHYSILGKVSPL